PNTYSYIVKPARYDSISRVYGDQSNAVSEVTTFTKPIITLTKKSSSSIKISWKKVDSASYYEVYRKVGSGAYKKLKNVSTTSYESKSLSKGKTYTYKVRAYTTVDGKKVYSTYSTAKSMKL
ncbi:MAG: fibronectin type III domain-containing protein, partial [Longicatena sp.]|nr:fibronectin type III domain-containing protein [Longicatena sp.]